MITKTTRSKWEDANNRLITRRASGVKDNAKCDSIVADYFRHFRSFDVGRSVLDVACGDQYLRQVVNKQHTGVKYTGIDAFTKGDGIIEAKIETLDTYKFNRDHGIHETVVCFAALDMMHDIEKACANMKKLASKNIVFLTGIDIEPDEFHTFKITHELLLQLMSGWKVNMSNYLTPKVLLIEFVPE